MSHETSVMRPKVVAALRPLDAMSVESGAHIGTPDINCTLGWIELKYVESWPVRETTPLAVPHFTPQQRAWIGRRARLGGFVCVLLKVGREWLLFDGSQAAERLGTATRRELLGMAASHMMVFNKYELRQCLNILSKAYPSVNAGELSGKALGNPKRYAHAP
jgi:hypothetical protein